MSMIAKLVSGGQTGVDRAALDFAIEAGIDYGGWCPRGGWAEDMATPPGVLASYPRLAETPGRDPEQRTRWNVRDSDATLIVTRAGSGSPGTERTLALARELGRPHAVADLTARMPTTAIAELLAGLGRDATLSVAGPRESEAPGIYAEARELLERLLDAQVARRSGGTSAT
jgi:hypothetical protein